ncbi:hypothetical protein HDU96_003770 [Phlyctochytrium bullatum]|nr:hypothetical protein HDU96_003770 [Phlyctochytrium bullatum]
MAGVPRALSKIEKLFAAFRDRAEDTASWDSDRIIRDDEDVTWIKYLNDYELVYCPYETDAEIAEARQRLRERVRLKPDLVQDVYRKHRYTTMRMLALYIGRHERSGRDDCRGCRWKSTCRPQPLLSLHLYAADLFSAFPSFFDASQPLWDPAVFGDLLQSVIINPRTYNAE